MTRSLITAALLAAPFAMAEEKDAVKAAFQGYKDAVVAQRGEDAAGWVTKSTIDEYQRYVDWAQTADRKTVERLPFGNRVQVLMIRHRVDTPTLRKANGHSIFVHAVDKDWTGKAGVMRMELGEVQVTGERATGKGIINGQPAGMDFVFRKENDKWRIDLMEASKASAPALQAAVARSGQEETAFILQMLEAISKKKPDDTIWIPVGKIE
jgi:hypothetical protein